MVRYEPRHRARICKEKTKIALFTDRKEDNMTRAQVISFDMDGTLTDMSFVNSVWLQGVPELYALKNEIPFEEALSQVKYEYDKVGREKLEWYDLGYWLNKFGISTTPKQVLASFVERIRVFEEVQGVLEKMKNSGYRLVIVTNARREFVDLEIKKTGIRSYFEYIFSSPSDFKLTKNGTTVYENVCTACEVSPAKMIHIGDDPEFDFEVPKKIGIRTFLLDRTGKKVGPSIVSSLEEFGLKL
jgi:HAD superfamily hydrolase (TIGR01549 family)